MNTLELVDERRAAREDGVGLVEIVVSMFMLAIMAIALLPILIQGLRVSASNATIATATQILNERLEIARSQPEVCSTVHSNLNGTSTATIVDPRGVTFRVVTTVDPCPTAPISAPRTIGVEIEVQRDDTGESLAVAKTLVFVSS